MKSDKSKVWAEFAPEEFYDAILKRNEDSASIAYYLIDKCLRKRLKMVFVNVGGEKLWEFQDTIDDFFLYLHDGTKWVFNKPFYMMESIESKEALFKWIVATYRNFMLKNYYEEMRRKAADNELHDDEPDIMEDDKILNLSTAIAYADQHYASRNRFVLYRLLLTFLNRNLAVPQEEMAEAVDMQPVAYRVSSKRAKDKMLDYIRCLENGTVLELDDEHTSMRDNLMHNFDKLYTILSDYYDSAIKKLPMADDIRRLRYLNNNGYVLHEDSQPYGLCCCHDVGYIYQNIKKFLNDKS